MGQGVGPIVMASSWMGQRVFARASSPPFQSDELGNLPFLIQELEGALIESGQEFEKAVAGASIRNDVTDTVITKGLTDPLTGISIPEHRRELIRFEDLGRFSDNIPRASTLPSPDDVLDHVLCFPVADG